MKKKSTIELINIVQTKENYNPDAISAALVVLQERGHIDPSDPKKLDGLDSIKNDLIEDERALHYERITSNNTEKNTSFKFLVPPFSNVLDQLSVYFCLITFNLILSFPYFGFAQVGWQIVLFSFIGIWQMNLISNDNNRRSYHFFARLLQAFFFTFTYCLFRDVVKNISEWHNSFGLFFFYLAITGITSVILRYSTPSYFVSKRYYFIHRLRSFLFIGPICIFLVCMLEWSWFIEKNILIWDENNPFSVEHFNGYPDFFTKYDGAISQAFEYEFDDNDRLKYLRAICNTHETWVNPWDKDSYFLLQHERYHFHITEWAARMARKKIYDTLQYGSDKQGVLKVIKRYSQERARLQTLYDEETDHSLISDEQSRWQYKIDSALMELDLYWSSEIFGAPKSNDTSQYSRKLFLDASWQLKPGILLMPSEEKYTDHYRISYDQQNRVKRIEHLFQEHLSNDQTYEASIIKIKYDGNAEYWEFFDEKGKKTINKQGYFSRKIDRKNNQLSLSFYDLNNKRCPNYLGIYLRKIDLNAEGKKYRSRYYDLNGQQVLSNKGEYDLRYSYEENAMFPSSVRNYDHTLSPLENKYGVFEKSYTYDSLGYQLSFCEKDKNLAYLWTDGHVFEKDHYNELGIQIARSYHGQYGELAQNSDGVARIEWPEDRYGNVNRKSLYNRNGVLTAENDEAATVYKKFDNRNNLLIIAEYGTGNELIFDEDSYGKVVYEYDSLNRETRITNLNGYDYPIRSSVSGRISLINYDSTGLIETRKYVNVHMQIDTAKNGSAQLKYVYDNARNLLSKAYYDNLGQPIAVVNNASRFEYQYDTRGNKIKSTFFNTKDEIGHGDNGIAIYRYLYDSADQLLERSYHDSTDRLTLYEGVAKLKWKYNSLGQTVEKQQYGIDDSLLDSGISVVRKRYDNQGRLIENRFLDASFKLLTTEPSIVKYEYDRYGNQTKVENYNHDGIPVVDDDGVHVYHYLYNDDLYVQRTYFDQNGNLVGDKEGIAIIKMERDSYGNLLEERYYDDQDQLTNDTLGVAIMTLKLDDYDRVVQENYFDKTSKPCLRYGKYHEVKYKRAPSGYILETHIYDTNGKLVEDEENVAIYKTSYSRNGTATSTTYNLEEALQLTTDALDSLANIEKSL